MITAVVITGDAALTARLATVLEGAAMVATAQPSIDAITLVITELNPRVVFVDIEHPGSNDRSFADILAVIRKLRPDQYVIAVGDELAPHKILAAIRAGANDYVDAGSSADELRERTLSHLKPSAARTETHSATVTMILSGRPNDGESFVSMHLAAARAKAGGGRADVVLVDFNLPISECEMAFGVALNYTVADAIADLPRLDRTLLASALPRHEATGLYFLPLAAAAKPLSLPSSSSLASLLDVLCSTFNDVVVNLGCLRHSDVLTEILPLASRLVMVTTQSLSSICCCSDVLRKIRAQGVITEKDVLAVSECYRGVEPGAEKITKALAIASAVVLPPERAFLLASLNEGALPMLSHPHSAYTRAIESLMRLVYDDKAVKDRGETAGAVRRVLHSLRCLVM